jgi:anion-transporting  ArsA/GET3 family ATPase
MTHSNDMTSRPPPVLLVMGKGGVGKTTVASALASLAAERGGRAVLVRFDDTAVGPGGSRSTGLATSGAKPDPAADEAGLGVIEQLVLTGDDAVRRGATPLFGSQVLARLALDNFAMRPLLRAAPAVRELAILEAIRQIAADRPGVRVVVDMPATGHGVAWLRTARRGRAFLRAGPLHDLCDRVVRELLAPGRAVPIVVSLPERLVLEETRELCDALALDPGLSVGAIVVNRVPTAFPSSARAAAEALHVASPQAGFGSVLSLLAAREAARSEACEAIDALAGQGASVWTLPAFPTDPPTRAVAAALADATAGGWP